MLDLKDKASEDVIVQPKAGVGWGVWGTQGQRSGLVGVHLPGLSMVGAGSL